MRKTLGSLILASLLVAAGGPAALAQGADGTPGNAGPPPTVDPLPNPGPDEPSPVTGELVPLPVAPPEGAAADINLPNCTPPACGVPQIMSE